MASSTKRGNHPTISSVSLMTSSAMSSASNGKRTFLLSRSWALWMGPGCGGPRLPQPTHRARRGCCWRGRRTRGGTAPATWQGRPDRRVKAKLTEEQADPQWSERNGHFAPATTPIRKAARAERSSTAIHTALLYGTDRGRVQARSKHAQSEVVRNSAVLVHGRQVLLTSSFFVARPVGTTTLRFYCGASAC